MLGELQRSEGEEHDGQAVATEPGRQVGEDLLNHDEADRRIDGPFHGRDPGADDQHHEDEREFVVPLSRIGNLLLNGDQDAPQSGDGPGQSEHRDPLPREVDPQSGRGRFAAPHGGQIASGRPFAHQQDHEDTESQHADGENEQRMAVEVEEFTGAQPLGLQAQSLGTAGDGHRIEEGVVEEQGGGQRHERQPESAQAQGEEGDDHGHDGRQDRPDQAADQHVQTKVIGQLGRGEGSHPGQGRLEEGDLPRHAGDQSDREEDGGQRQAGIEAAFPRVGDPGEHGDDEAGQHHPPQDADDPVHAGCSRRHRRRRGRRVDGGQGVPARVERPHAGQEEQGAHQHEEGERGQHGRVEQASGGQVPLQGGADHADEHGHTGGDGYRTQETPGGCGNGRHHQRGIGVRLEGAENGRQQDTGQPGHETRDGPGHGHHTARVHTVELHQATALHRTAHLQAQVGEAQEDGQCHQHHDRHGDRGQVDPVHRRPRQGEIHHVGIEEGEDRGGVVQVLGPEDHREDGGDTDQQGDGADQLGRRIRIGNVAEDEAVEGEPDEGRHHHDRDHEGQPPRHVMVLGQDREHEGGREGLGPEGKVEDTGGLIGQDQAHRHDGVATSIRDARESETEKVLHA